MSFLSYLFDYNGVLIDDESVHLDAFRDALLPYGVTVSDAAYQAKYLGFDDVGAFRAILADNGIAFDSTLIGSLVAAKGPLYLQRALRGLSPFSGASDLLNRLARNGAVIGIVSGALRAEIDLGLRLLGAENAVRFVVSAEDTQACKPDPEGYVIGRAKLEKLTGKRVAHRVLVVEDSLAGVKAARAANLPCLAVSHSYQASELVQAGALHVVSQLAEIDNQLLATLSAEVYGSDV
jgi:HAD superfamily hydrolase (TIGR01509 family)